MATTTLRFHARGTALVQNFERLEAGIKSFIGRRKTQIEAPKNPGDPEDTGVWGFAPTGELEEVANRAEYVKACKDGDLYPSDEETARACGVAFDKTFGAPAPEKTAVKTAEKVA